MGGLGGGGLEEVMIQERPSTNQRGEEGQVQISQQAQHCSKVRYRFRGKRNTFRRSGTAFAAGAALQHGPVQIRGQISRQAQHFRRRCQFRRMRRTFARHGAEFEAGAALNQRGGWGGG